MQVEQDYTTNIIFNASLVMLKDYSSVHGEWVFWMGRTKENREGDVLREHHLHQPPIGQGCSSHLLASWSGAIVVQFKKHRRKYCTLWASQDRYTRE